MSTIIAAIFRNYSWKLISDWNIVSVNLPLFAKVVSTDIECSGHSNSTNNGGQNVCPVVVAHIFLLLLKLPLSYLPQKSVTLTAVVQIRDFQIPKSLFAKVPIIQ